MVQRYNVRLGDGTVLKVDQDGLHAWLEDREAAVQIAGAQEWRPLREFLAEQESAARLAQALVPPEPRRASAPSPPEVLPPGSGNDPSTNPWAPAPPWREPPGAAAEADDLPVLRLKPLDDEPPAGDVFRGDRTSDEGDEEEEGERHDRLEGPLLRAISAFGNLLSRCLDPLAPLVRGGPSTTAGETAPGRAAPTARSGARKALPTAAPPPRAPVAAPVPIRELPVLRFADVPEPRVVEDVYQGEEDRRPLPAFWLWTKRVVLVGVLVVGGALAALRWETWLPRAAELGQEVFTGIDRWARSGQTTQEQQRALSEATGRLPHLAPETIRLVLSTSDTGVLDPPEVFQLATEAADRGLRALTPAEAAELRELQSELLGNLRPPERARLAEYDRARSRRVVFPFENPHALELVARGARAMSPPSRERLQALLGKAVAAGLASR